MRERKMMGNLSRRRTAVAVFGAVAAGIYGGCRGPSEAASGVDQPSPPTAVAQQPSAAPQPTLPAELAEVTTCKTGEPKLEEPFRSMVGEWRGSGWVEMQPGSREHFDMWELIRCSLSGQVLLIQGLGRAAAGDNEPVHQSLGVISFDRAKGVHRMRAYTAGRDPVDSDMPVAADGTVTWGFDQGPVKVRFRIELSGGDAWRETGEASYQGGPWRKFFEMNLSRSR